jgi:hypothetical protein
MFCAVLCRSPVCFSRHQLLAPFFDVKKIATAQRRCHRHRTSNQPKICAGTKIVTFCAGLCRFVRFVPQSRFVFGPTVTCPLFLTDETIVDKNWGQLVSKAPLSPTEKTVSLVTS